MKALFFGSLDSIDYFLVTFLYFSVVMNLREIGGLVDQPKWSTTT